MGHIVEFKRPDKKSCSGYCVDPVNDGKAPGVVIIQEWWGVNDQIKGVADRLAESGYRALVPDLYRGKVALEMKEAEHLMTNLNFGDAATQDVRGAVQHLKEAGSKVAVMGYCMGGALTLLSVANAPEVDAAVTWYGIPPLEHLNVQAIRVPLLGHFADEDSFFGPPLVEALEGKLKQANVKYEFYRYKAKHAFANENNTNPEAPIAYNADAASLAWKRTLDFLGKHIK